MSIPRRVALAVIAFCLAPLAAAQSKDPPRKPVVGFSQVGAESAWRTAETASIKDEASKRGVELKFADAQGKQAAQVRSLRSFIAQKVDYIILAPIVESGWDEVLGDAKAAGIPVLLVDRGVKVKDESLFVTLIASDFVEEGRMAGEWLAKQTGGKASIVELQGTTGAAPAIDRRKGFAQAIAAHPDMRIIKSQSGDFSRAKGKEVMEAFIKSEGRKITAVYAHNDDMALGAIQALDEAGMKPGAGVTVISIDAVKGAFEAMVEGKLNATVECNPLLGPMAFDTIEKHRKGETIPKFIKQTDRLFDQSQAAEAIKMRQY
ncbi:ABC transporter periplasmic-binding protein YtfQ [Phycisphaerales bacterium]|nr:ABC transporter periplasmic-binding protein YtfQ [Phycisphaerales bacterium]